jgi:hypothetical protein
MDDRKQAVRDFWNAASCGEDLYLRGETREGYQQQSLQRYALEPYIIPFADLPERGGSGSSRSAWDWGPIISVSQKAGPSCTGST